MGAWCFSHCITRKEPYFLLYSVLYLSPQNIHYTRGVTLSYEQLHAQYMNNDPIHTNSSINVCLKNSVWCPEVNISELLIIIVYYSLENSSDNNFRAFLEWGR